MKVYFRHEMSSSYNEISAFEAKSSIVPCTENCGRFVMVISHSSYACVSVLSLTSLYPQIQSQRAILHRGNLKMAATLPTPPVARTKKQNHEINLDYFS
jgi:hypothetical protein